MNYPLVEIDWLDAEDISEWQDEEETKKFFNETPIVTSVGFLFMEDDTWIGIFGDRSEEKEPDYGRLMKIPKSMIKEIRKLTE